jgi:hypothetical protein
MNVSDTKVEKLLAEVLDRLQNIQAAQMVTAAAVLALAEKENPANPAITQLAKKLHEKWFLEGP